MRFGEELRSQRESRGISLEDVAVSTRVSPRHLQALEEDRFGELPGGVFSRGIIRSYAQFCGLDADRTTEHFLAALHASGVAQQQKDDDWVEFAEAVRRNRTTTKSPRRLRWLGVLLMLMAVATLTAAVTWLLVTRGLVRLPPRATDFIHHVKRAL